MEAEDDSEEGFKFSLIGSSLVEKCEFLLGDLLCPLCELTEGEFGCLVLLLINNEDEELFGNCESLIDTGIASLLEFFEMILVLVGCCGSCCWRY